MRSLTFFTRIFFFLMVVGLSHPAKANETPNSDILTSYLVGLTDHGFEYSIYDGKELSDGVSGAELVIKKRDHPDWKVTLTDFVLKQPQNEEDTGLSGISFTISEGRFQNGKTLGIVKNIELTDFALPQLERMLGVFTIGFQGETPSALEALDLYVASLRLFMDGRFALFSSAALTVKDQTSETAPFLSAKSMTLKGLWKGKLETVDLKELSRSTTLPDGKRIKTQTEEIQYADINVASLLHVIDTKAYEDRKGDGVWKAAFGPSYLENTRLFSEQGEFHIEKMTLAPMKIKQFDTLPEEAFKALDDLEKLSVGGQPTKEVAAEAAQLWLPIASLFNAFVHDGFLVEKISFQPLGAKPVLIDKIEVGSYSFGDGISTILVSGLDVQSSNGDGGLNLGTLSMRSIQLPALSDVIAYFNKVAAEGQSSAYEAVSAFAATVGGAQITDLVVSGGASGSFKLKQVDLALENYVKIIPTQLKIDLVDLDIMLLNSEGQPNPNFDFLRSLGYETLLLNGLIDAEWDQTTNELTILPSNLDAGDLGEILLSGVISGVQQDLFENPDQATQYLASLSLNNLSFSLKDDSVLDRIVARVASETNTSSEVVKRQYTGLVSGYLAVLQNPEFNQKALTALRSFLENPGTLTLTASPTEPVPLIAVGLLIQQAPGQIIDLLKLDIEAK